MSPYTAVESSVFDGMRALVVTLEAKDPYTEGHSLRLAKVAVAICRQLGLGSHVENLVRYAGALHDIGKVGIPDAILRKPGRLTPEEYEQMKAHPVLSWKILLPFSFLQEEAVIVRHHHEWMNGGLSRRTVRIGDPSGVQNPGGNRCLRCHDHHTSISGATGA
ncbi:MAG: HD domain-containing protein [Candidatus Methylomirabilis sp.]|nr:HD domain-containing protein [Candidatus Methylomirabilis sp.]